MKATRCLSKIMQVVTVYLFMLEVINTKLTQLTGKIQFLVAILVHRIGLIRLLDSKGMSDIQF